eukprot:scaffold272769_cov31-Tisochrysis_lutea.AAC.1
MEPLREVVRDAHVIEEDTNLEVGERLLELSQALLRKVDAQGLVSRAKSARQRTMACERRRALATRCHATFVRLPKSTASVRTSTLGQACLSSLATSSSFDCVLEMSTTEEPRRASSKAMALPMPSVAPVTTAHLP